jgi:WD40 repeat protein
MAHSCTRRPAYIVEWSPDGSRLATALDGAKVWDVASGALLATLPGFPLTVSSISWSPDGSRLVVGGGGRTMRIYDVTTWDPLEIATSYERGAHSPVWSPDGTMLATSGAFDSDDPVMIWDTATATLRAPRYQQTFPVPSWSPDSRRLVTASTGNDALVWDTAAVSMSVPVRSIRSNSMSRRSCSKRNGPARQADTSRPSTQLPGV